MVKLAEIFEFIDSNLLKENKKEPILAKEYAYNMDTAQFKYRNGKMYFVYEKEALMVKLWKLFMSERYRWVVFDWNYGHELETLIGKAYTQGYVNSEAERFCKEAVKRSLGEYIKSLDDFIVKFEEGVLYISFTADTIYGNLPVKGMPINL